MGALLVAVVVGLERVVHHHSVQLSVDLVRYPSDGGGGGSSVSVSGVHGIGSIAGRCLSITSTHRPARAYRHHGQHHPQAPHNGERRVPQSE